MIVRKIQTEYTLPLPPPKTPRSPGVHISGIIRCIAVEAGILNPKWVEELSLTDTREITDPAAVLRISIGLAWEEFYIAQLPDVVDHPDEMCVDGVYMSKDGESVSVIITDRGPTRRLIVHEVKATYKSLNTVNNIETQWMWLAQMKAYCKGSNTRLARLHVLFLCGDYSYPIGPQLHVWEIEFTDDEIESNWDLLLEYRDQQASLEFGA